VAADPYTGTVEAALECAANLACAGAEPLGTTNNLNFGNPEKPHIAWQLSEACRGLGDACRALGAPVVGGNVSLYNEGAAGPIYPTPVVGMVGRLPDVRRAARLGFRHAGEQIALVGPFAPAWPPASWPSCAGSRCPMGLPHLKDVQAVLHAQAAVRAAVRARPGVKRPRHCRGRPRRGPGRVLPRGGLGAHVRLAHDLWHAAARLAPGERSAAPVSSPETLLFGEAPGGFLVSGQAQALASVGEGTPVYRIGTVGGDQLSIAVAAGTGTRVRSSS